ncbi:MAG: hypothetical protein U9O55_02115 [Patescibacteria group bacterium]|nr:hypothetical protein [Patescibacteria group bacterium]
MNLLKEGNVRALKFGCYTVCVIIALFIYNLFIKIYFDPCCQENTFGEFMFLMSSFLSYILGIGIIVTVIFVFIKIKIDKFRPKREILFKKRKESALNLFFIVILLANFCLLLAAQLPKILIGCVGCEIEQNSKKFLDSEIKNKTELIKF